MPKFKVMVVRFPYGGREDSECVDWLMKTYHAIATDPRFEVVNWRINDTPITMTRNLAFDQAVRQGVDFLLIVDSDMAPDVELGEDPTAKPFWPSTIDFMLRHAGPCVVAAPYCGPPPHENVYVFTWGNLRNDSRDGDVRIDQYSREHAAGMTGIQEAAALPTGLMLIDCRVFQKLTPPYTYYEFEGVGHPCDACGQPHRGPETKKASTEDVTFSRDLALAGVPMYCNWDAWAGHVKRHVVRKPRPYTTDSVAQKMRQAILSRRNANERIVDVGPKDGRLAALVKDALLKHTLAEGFSPQTSAVFTPEPPPGQVPDLAGGEVLVLPKGTFELIDADRQPVSLVPVEPPPGLARLTAAELFGLDPDRRVG